jgi:hypothetical protein
MITDSQLRQFREDGFVIIPGIAPALLGELQAAAERVTERARRGDWANVRKCGDGDIWGVSSLLHPDLGEPVFARYLASPEVLDTCAALLPGEPLRLSLTNMLVNPAKADYEIGWHRDASTPNLSPEAEMAMLQGHMASVQWNAALFAESCLRFVPGSHRRHLTTEERRIWASDALAPMPGELRVHLEPGQTIYYNSRGLHKGDYPMRCKRLTLHANIVSLNAKPFAGHYHWVSYMAEPGFGDRLPPALRPLHQNWLTFAAQIKALETPG